jgi:3-hydroxyisobutyrate dehydrogenase
VKPPDTRRGPESTPGMRSDPPVVGFVGLGRMGSRMAANLASAGFPVVVFNRTEATARSWVAAHGGIRAGSPRELAEQSDVVVTMLADGEALVDTYESDDGVLAGISPGMLAVDMGTSGPAAFHTVRENVEGAGATMVDAPVSGATPAAEAATLLIMVGAEPDVFARVEPVLSVIGEPRPVGPVGSAVILKLAVNSVLYALNQAVGEAVVLSESAGVSPGVAIDVLADSAAGAPLVGYRRDQYVDPASSAKMFTLDLEAKDLRLALEAAERAGVRMDQARATLEITAQIISAGAGGEDMGYVVEANRRRSRRS